jgi:hypothetical protein
MSFERTASRKRAPIPRRCRIGSTRKLPRREVNRPIVVIVAIGAAAVRKPWWRMAQDSGNPRAFAAAMTSS